MYSPIFLFNFVSYSFKLTRSTPGCQIQHWKKIEHGELQKIRINGWMPHQNHCWLRDTEIYSNGKHPESVPWNIFPGALLYSKWLLSTSKTKMRKFHVEGKTEGSTKLDHSSGQVMNLKRNNFCVGCGISSFAVIMVLLHSKLQIFYLKFFC